MRRTILHLFLIFILWRMFLFAPLIIGEKLLPYREGYDYTNIWEFTKQYSPVDNILLYPWANFDGVYYLTIAGSGYTVDNAGFFPVFPLLTRMLATVFGSDKPYGAIYFFSALFIVHTSFFLSILVFYKLLLLDYNHKTTFRAIIFLLLFPTSFFFVSIYSESVFLLLTLLAFYFARKKQWFFAGLAAMVLMATRIVGIAIFPALIYEFFLQKKTLRSSGILSLFLAPLGIFGYAVFNKLQWGDYFRFLEVHGTLGNSRVTDSIVLFPQTLFRYGKILFSVSPSVYEWWIAILELATFFVVAILIYVGWKKRIRLSYLLFALVSFLIPASSGTFTGLPRYAVVMFPIFITLALIKSKWIRFTYVTISMVLLGLLLMLFSRGYFVS